ncbi:conserved glutamic acid-rich protein [Aspergillus sclerotialis]|uniref:Conserved glutamic acid-rich protein n=1 Tax=Aspergillus sclerotialis TaxID=2070753 RepID=A0A3A2ZQ81_9EURO|nr:conserved glutamic acid-rich protein [Aspergillus sclerotialis]
MEVPVDDTMEMASPYQGHVDDFEIDLDVMEDQISNPDKDMTVVDDYPPTSNNMDYYQYGANDTDMTDDVAEGAMVDADDQYPDNIDLQYGDEMYEEEMADDNFDEDIDIPAPNNEAQDVRPVSLDHTNNQGLGEQVQPAKHVEESPDETAIDTNAQTWDEPAQEPPHDSEQDDHIPEVPPQETHVDQTGSVHAEEGSRNANNAERPDARVHPDGDEVDRGDLSQPETEGDAVDKVQPPVENPKDHEVSRTEKQKVYEPNDQEPITADESGALHPVKVYYQDNEISLFPPREGDSSEMFFLEDESLAYQDFGKLFSSCHEVLRESIGENEILIMDIESLDIQLTEDSPHTSKVTLSEIVDIYLHLCHNEDINEPEPLYLTLNTKLTFPAQLSELITAANEGKGLSEIQPWDDYEETAAPVEVENGEYNQELDVAPPQDASAREDSRHYDESQKPLKETEPSVQAQGMDEKPEEGEQLKGDDKLAGGNSEHATSAETGEVEDDSFENPEPQDDAQETSKPEVGDDFPNEGAYDSEAPRTESTATIAQTNLEDEQEAEESGNVSANDQVSPVVHEGHDGTQHPTVDSEYHGPEDTAHGEHDGEYDEAQGTSAQGEYYVEEASHGSLHGDYDANYDKVHGEYRDTDDYYEDYGAEPDVNAPEQLENSHTTEPYEGEGNLENPHEGPSSNYHEENESGEDQPDGTLEDGELYVEEFEDEDGPSYDTSDIKQDSALQDVSEGKPRHGAGPADELLGVSDDSNNPVKGTTPVIEEADDQVDSAAVGDEENGSQTVPEDPDDWNFDDEEYTDLGAPDTFEAGDADSSFTDSHAHENVSAKRTREAEEEFELDGGPSLIPSVGAHRDFTLPLLQLVLALICILD